ncbi:MAG: NUDIX hydrolase [Patescibacteria group bacterium]
MTLRFSALDLNGCEVRIPSAIDEQIMNRFIADNGRPDDTWSVIAFIRVFPNGALSVDPIGRELTEEEAAAKAVRPKRIPLGYVFVIDYCKSQPWYYKMPGGKKHDDETVLTTGVREIYGETGLALSPETHHYQYEGAVWRGRFWNVLVSVDVEENVLSLLNSEHHENEGEVPKYVSVDEFHRIMADQGFLPSQYHRLYEKGLIIVPPDTHEGMNGLTRP